MTYPEQRYRLTYPEKNAVWWSPTPSKCTVEKQKECCARAMYTPTRQNQCKSTFMPWDRPDPYQCLKLCQGIDVKAVGPCLAEKLQHPKLRPSNGCLREPSIMEYTNKPLNQGFRSRSILTDPQRNPPMVPETMMKNSNAYDPFLWVFGDPYTY